MVDGVVGVRVPQSGRKGELELWRVVMRQDKCWRSSR